MWEQSKWAQEEELRRRSSRWPAKSLLLKNFSSSFAAFFVFNRCIL
jgi:hypothetical protein